MKSSDLVYLLPELILLATAALVLLLDLLGDKGRAKPWLPYVALVGLGTAIVGVLPSLGGAHVVAGTLAIDPFATFFKVLAMLGVAIVILTAVPYMEGRTPFRGEFYAFLVIVALAISLAVSATNLVMIYLSIEFLSITSYVLAGYIRHDRKSGEAAMKYFLYGSTASAVMLYGMSLLYGATGTTDLTSLANAFAGQGAEQLVWLGTPAIILLLAGFGFKASLVPFHQWAPDTYEGAPTPITAFLSTASKATGFAVLIRVFLVAMGQPPLQEAWTALLIALSIATMTVGNLTALFQSNMKRLLAYSSIAQAGYILMGVAAVLMAPGRTFNGINGVLIYLFGYLFTNIGAFAVVMAVENATGNTGPASGAGAGTEVKDYAGLVQRAPWLAGLLFIFLVSLAGIPPTVGFLGKFFVFGAAIQQQLFVLAAVAAINSVVAAFYYLNVVRYMFFTPAEDGASRIAVAPALQGALLVTGALTLLLGLIPEPLITWATRSVQMIGLIQ